MFEVNPSVLRQAGYAFARYDYPVKSGTPFSALLLSEYWTGIAGKLRRFDVIRVVAEDGTFDAELSVANNPLDVTGPLPVAKMRVLRYWDPSEDGGAAAVQEAEAAATEGGFSTGWGGPNHRWRVVDPNGHVIHKGCETEAAAVEWLEAYKTDRKLAA